jgi:hypothetical protein
MLRALRKIPAVRRWYYTLRSPVALDRFKPNFDDAIKINRGTLSLVPCWLNDEVYEASIFQYGLPPHIRAFIDDPIDDSPTYTDLIVHLARLLGNLRYLELGPSVGKNLFQVAKAVQDAVLTAVDIEDINPILEQHLERMGTTKWQTVVGSKRVAHSTLSRYKLGNNSVEYIAGDLFDNATWEQLRGKSFNLIFSDAFHSPEALLMEWDNISRLELLGPGPFAMVWDDLTTAGMRRSFYEIAVEVTRRRPGAVVSLELLQGWVGKREELHPIGIIRSGL